MISAPKKLTHENWSVALVILLQTLLMVLINISIIVSNDLTELKKEIPYINFAILLLGLFSLFTIKKVEKNAKYRTSNLLLNNHLSQMESILNSSRTQRHEYSKHIQTLQALIELNKIAEAKAYVNGITKNYWPTPSVYHIDHPAVEGLINSKNAVAQMQNINFAVAVKCDMSKIHIPDWDLCSILGNLLDNAFEAAATDEEARVGIEFKYEDHHYVFYINNNGSRISDPDKVLAAGYTTKESEGRGYGLYIVNKLVQKYKGNIEIITRPKTTVILRFPGRSDIND